MKTKLSFILGGFLLLAQTVMAQTTFSVSASVPAATGVSMTVSKVTVDSSGTITSFVAQPAGTVLLPFGQLQLNPALGIYADGPANATYYWAIDITPSGGAGSGYASAVTYTEGSVPTGQAAGLGAKTGIQFSKVVYISSSSAPETPITGQHYRLNQMTGAVVPPSSAVAGGWMRMDIGLCTGNATTDPAGCAPFTNADKSGPYSGSLQVTGAVA